MLTSSQISCPTSGRNALPGRRWILISSPGPAALSPKGRNALPGRRWILMQAEYIRYRRRGVVVMPFRAGGGF